MIQLEHVDFGYRPRRPLFTDLSLELGPGHIHGLLGSNGMGKSTLLKLVCGLLTARQGRIDVQGEDPRGRRPDLYSQVFFVPEEFSLPAVRFSTYVRFMAPFYPDFSDEMLRTYMWELELSDDQRLDRLSMGQKKRVQIAFALACNTPVLLLDEPTNGLDIPSKRVFRQLLASYADARRTVVISTHQVRDIDNLIDSVVILDRRGVLVNATTEQVTRSLRFAVVDEGDDPIYAEESIQGQVGVMENTTGRDSKINLELLFNAAVKHPDRIRHLLERASESSNPAKINRDE